MIGLSLDNKYILCKKLATGHLKKIINDICFWIEANINY